GPTRREGRPSTPLTLSPSKGGRTRQTPSGPSRPRSGVPRYHRGRGRTCALMEPVLETAMAQFHKAADQVGLTDQHRELLTSFKTIYQTEFPVEMDDGTFRIFQGYRVLHNN